MSEKEITLPNLEVETTIPDIKQSIIKKTAKNNTSLATSISTQNLKNELPDLSSDELPELSGDELPELSGDELPDLNSNNKTNKSEQQESILPFNLNLDFLSKTPNQLYNEILSIEIEGEISKNELNNSFENAGLPSNFLDEGMKVLGVDKNILEYIGDGVSNIKDFILSPLLSGKNINLSNISDYLNKSALNILNNNKGPYIVKDLDGEINKFKTQKEALEYIRLIKKDLKGDSSTIVEGKILNFYIKTIGSTMKLGIDGTELALKTAKKIIDYSEGNEELMYLVYAGFGGSLALLQSYLNRSTSGIDAKVRDDLVDELTEFKEQLEKIGLEGRAKKIEHTITKIGAISEPGDWNNPTHKQDFQNKIHIELRKGFGNGINRNLKVTSSFLTKYTFETWGTIPDKLSNAGFLQAKDTNGAIMKSTKFLLRNGIRISTIPITWPFIFSKYFVQASPKYGMIPTIISKSGYIISYTKEAQKRAEQLDKISQYVKNSFNTEKAEEINKKIAKYFGGMLRFPGSDLLQMTSIANPAQGINIGITGINTFESNVIKIIWRELTPEQRKYTTKSKLKKLITNVTKLKDKFDAEVKIKEKFEKYSEFSENYTTIDTDTEKLIKKDLKNLINISENDEDYQKKSFKLLNDKYSIPKKYLENIDEFLEKIDGLKRTTGTPKNGVEAIDRNKIKNSIISNLEHSSLNDIQKNERISFINDFFSKPHEMIEPQFNLLVYELSYSTESITNDSQLKSYRMNADEIFDFGNLATQRYYDGVSMNNFYNTYKDQVDNLINNGTLSVETTNPKKGFIKKNWERIKDFKLFKGKTSDEAEEIIENADELTKKSWLDYLTLKGLREEYKRKNKVKKRAIKIKKIREERIKNSNTNNENINNRTTNSENTNNRTTNSTNNIDDSKITFRENLEIEYEKIINKLKKLAIEDKVEYLKEKFGGISKIPDFFKKGQFKAIGEYISKKLNTKTELLKQYKKIKLILNDAAIELTLQYDGEELEEKLAQLDKEYTNITTKEGLKGSYHIITSLREHYKEKFSLNELRGSRKLNTLLKELNYSELPEGINKFSDLKKAIKNNAYPDVKQTVIKAIKKLKISR